MVTEETLENNPIYLKLQEEIKSHLQEDLEKRDIREIMMERYATLGAELFEALYADAFTSL